MLCLTEHHLFMTQPEANSTSPGSIHGSEVARIICCSNKLAIILKYLLAITVGVTFRSFFDLPVAKNDLLQTKPECSCVSPAASNDLLESEINLQLRESFLPVSRHEVINYDFFNSTVAVDSSHCSHIASIKRIDRVEIAEVASQTSALVSSQRRSTWRVTGLENGYRRLDPARGMEYVIDVLLESPDSRVSDRRQIKLIRPFGFMRILADIAIEEERMIHFIVAVSEPSAEFRQFLTNFETIHLQNEQHSYLMIVVCVNSTSEADLIRAEGTALQRRHWRKLHVRVIQLKRVFNPALALDVGLRQLPNSALVMLLDIGMRISSSVLHRCRFSALDGKQIYYPVPFVQFVPDIVRQFSPENEVEQFAGLNKHTGEWDFDDYSTTCMYAGDYRAVGGFNSTINNWKLELYERHVASNLQIFRSVDPGLFRPFVNHTCMLSSTTSYLWPELCVGDGIAARHHLIQMLQNVSAPSLV